jgi:hypothetical protein
MDFKSLATLASLLSLPFGAAFLLAPGPSGMLYGVGLADPASLLVGRYFGSEVLMYAAATWALRALDDSAAQRRAAALLGAATVTGLGVSVLGVATGSLNAVGWSSVALYGGFAVGWLRLALRPVAGKAVRA